MKAQDVFAWFIRFLGSRRETVAENNSGLWENYSTYYCGREKLLPD
jgi:hypothetical protein